MDTINTINFNSIQEYINKGKELKSKVGRISEANILDAYLNCKDDQVLDFIESTFDKDKLLSILCSSFKIEELIDVIVERFKDSESATLKYEEFEEHILVRFLENDVIYVDLEILEDHIIQVKSSNSFLLEYIYEHHVTDRFLKYLFCDISPLKYQEVCNVIINTIQYFNMKVRYLGIVEEVLIICNMFEEYDIAIDLLESCKNGNNEVVRWIFDGQTVFSEYHIAFIRKQESVGLSGIKFVCDDLQYLNNCKKINLKGCNFVTDKSLKYLVNCTHINLRGCHRITNNGLKHLVNCIKINLRCCHRINLNSLKHLIIATEIDL